MAVSLITDHKIANPKRNFRKLFIQLLMGMATWQIYWTSLNKISVVLRAYTIFRKSYIMSNTIVVAGDTYFIIQKTAISLFIFDNICAW